MTVLLLSNSNYSSSDNLSNSRIKDSSSKSCRLGTSTKESIVMCAIDRYKRLIEKIIVGTQMCSVMGVKHSQLNANMWSEIKICSQSITL